MLIIGERINSTREKIRDGIVSRNASLILREAINQVRAGASFVDINCAHGSGNEVQDIDWVISVIQSEMKDVNICLDSPNYLAIERGLSVYKGNGRVMINSITLEDGRINNILPLAKRYNAKVIALTMGAKAMPDTAHDRFEIAKELLGRMKAQRISESDVYFDPLIRPAATEPKQAKEFLDALLLVKSLGVATVCGLSNISFGLPNRSLINATLLSMAMNNGLDACIIDPMDKRVMSHLAASEMLLGTDEYCQMYIKSFREGVLV